MIICERNYGDLLFLECGDLSMENYEGFWHFFANNKSDAFSFYKVSIDFAISFLVIVFLYFLSTLENKEFLRFVWSIDNLLSSRIDVKSDLSENFWNLWLF